MNMGMCKRARDVNLTHEYSITVNKIQCRITDSPYGKGILRIFLAITQRLSL